jgi:hypothetical protein
MEGDGKPPGQVDPDETITIPTKQVALPFKSKVGYIPTS